MPARRPTPLSSLPARSATPAAAPAAKRRAEWPVTKTLPPGAAGTLRLLKQFGDALVCVRYRHDATGLHRCTTVEIVVARAPVHSRHIDEKLFDVEIGYAEHELQVKARTHGGRWDREKKLWKLRGAAVRELGLTNRVRLPPTGLSKQPAKHPPKHEK